MKTSNLKIVITLCLIMTFGTVLQAQSHSEEIDLYQSMYGMQKKDMLSSFVSTDNAEFWTLYDAYEAERKELGKTRLELLKKYSKYYDALGDEVTDELIKEMQSLKKNLDKIINKYYKKINKTSGPKVAAQFYQFENYLQSAVRLEVLENIPFVGELE